MTQRMTLKLILVGFAVVLTSASVACWGEPAPIDSELLERAKAGDAIAQLALGRMYFHGDGVTQDYAQALKWWRSPAEQGHAEAQSGLGVMYATGQGVEQDYAEAVKWSRKAAEQGDARAQSNLGVMYECGDGVKQDYAEAVKWYRKAAEQGDARGQDLLRGAEERRERNLRLAEERRERRDACRLGLQADQREFVRTLGNLTIRYDKEENEIRKSGIFNEAQAYSEKFFNVRGRTITNWGAKLSDLRTSKGGRRASVRLSINFSTQGGGIFLEKVHFWDSGIRPGSSIYASLGKMNEGDRVVFSATDISTEGSITEVGAMRNPEYESKLTDISSCSNHN